jgi:hypothetical protein
MKALIIDEPWITMILNGEKTWEMRARASRHRGLMALVRKGTGLVVGIAELADCLPPLSPEDYRSAEKFHRVPPADQPEAAKRWPTPWVLRNVVPLANPVPYSHKFGAQSEILLSEDEAAAVRRQAGLQTGSNGLAAEVAPHASTEALERPVSVRSIRADTSPPAARRKAVTGRIEGNTAVIPLTAGNIKNNHFYLRSILSFFPDAAIGGSDASQASRELLTIVYRPGPPGPSRTDIAGPNRASREKRSSHYFFRERTPIREFFARSGAEEGDEVVIERKGPTEYVVTLRKQEQ